MGAVDLEPVPQGDVVALEPEDPLDLVPDGQHQEQGEPEEDREGEDEAQPRLRLLAAASRACIPPRPVVVISPVDGIRVDRRGLGGSHHATGWLGHPVESSAGRCRSLGRYLGWVG